MKYRLLILLLGLVILVGCQKSECVAPFSVVGDIENNITYFDTAKSLNVDTFLTSLNPLYTHYDVLLTSQDGFAVKVDGDTLEDASLCFSEDTGWMFESDSHPVNSRIKWITDVIVMRKETEVPNFTSGLNIIMNDKDNHFSYGELLTMAHRIDYRVDGTTKLDDIAIDVMKEYRSHALNDLIKADYQWLLVMDSKGGQHYLPYSDYHIVMENGMITLQDEKRDDIVDVVGILVDPPSFSIMDNYYDALNYIEKDIPVLTLFIDGFSYFQWEHIKSQYPELFLSNLAFNQAVSVYTPVTNAGFAAMISGQTPLVSGVIDRSVRQLACETLFDKVDDGILVDGLVKILDIPADTFLVQDVDGDGYTDAEVYEKALEVIDGPYALVHFNGIDDAGHTYGPYAEETIAKMIEIDQYIKGLVAQWDGKVIILADHGMHETNEGGDHGLFQVDDLMVPYIVIDGGQYE